MLESRKGVCRNSTTVCRENNEMDAKSAIILLVVVGVILALVPIDPTIRYWIVIICVIVAVVWLVTFLLGMVKKG